MQSIDQIPDDLPWIGGNDAAVSSSSIDAVFIDPAIRRIGCGHHEIALLVLAISQVLVLEPEIAKHSWLTIDLRLIKCRLICPGIC